VPPAIARRNGARDPPRDQSRADRNARTERLAHRDEVRLPTEGLRIERVAVRLRPVCTVGNQ
jgi:hypothetical protein